jgi:Rrf2 family protein
VRLLASTDIALRVVMLLGQQTDAGEPMKVETIAQLLGNLSRNHLHKIVQDLSARGIVRTVRGVRGGVVLGDNLGEIRLGDMIRELEADQTLVDCFRSDGGSCVLKPCCQLSGMLYEAQESFYSSLNRKTLADLIKNNVPIF